MNRKGQFNQLTLRLKVDLWNASPDLKMLKASSLQVYICQELRKLLLYFWQAPAKDCSTLENS